MAVSKLEELLAGIKPDNLHGEMSFGSPVGQEVWPMLDSGVGNSEEPAAE